MCNLTKAVLFYCLFWLAIGQADGQNFNQIGSVALAAGGTNSGSACDSTNCYFATQFPNELQVVNISSKNVNAIKVPEPFTVCLNHAATPLVATLSLGNSSVNGYVTITDPSGSAPTRSILLSTQVPLECGFSPDDSSLYVGSQDSQNQLTKIDTTSWQVVQSWNTPAGFGMCSLSVSSTGKVFMIIGTSSQIYEIAILENNGIEVPNFGTFVLPGINTIGPNGLVYLGGMVQQTDGQVPTTLVIDPADETVVRTINDLPGGLLWPTSDPYFAYEVFGTGGITGLNLYTGARVWSATTTPSNYGMGVNRQPDGSDLVLLLHGSSLDYYSVTEPTLSYVAVNIGSYDPKAGLPAGSIGALFGANMASTTSAPGVLPLLTSIDGTEVIVDGQPAPLFFISPGQINFLVPSFVTGYTTLVVVGPQGTSAEIDFNAPPFAPALLTWPSGYVNSGLPLVVHLNGTVDSAGTRGETVIMFGTGFGEVSPSPKDGSPAGLPSSLVMTPFQLTISGIQSSVPFAGLVDGFVGLVQLNVKIPYNAPAGNNPLDIAIIGEAGAIPAYENSVTVMP